MQRRPGTTGAFWLIVFICVVWTSAFYQNVAGAAARAPSRQANASGQEQIAKGRQAVAETCVPCHPGIFRIVQLHKKSAQEWRNTVYSMIGRGAHILPEEIEPLAVFLAQAGTAAPASTPLPADVGSILQRRCVQCHDLELATRKPASGDWKAVITRMVSYGADISSAEQQTLLAYFTR